MIQNYLLFSTIYTYLRY